MKLLVVGTAAMMLALGTARASEVPQTGEVGSSGGSTLATALASADPELPTDKKILLAARDSAAVYLMDGQVDLELVRAFEVLNDMGYQNLNAEEKAAAILDLTK